MNRPTRLLALGLVIIGIGTAYAADPQPAWVLREPGTIEWRPAENLPPGAMVAVLEGDPSKEGFFTMRLKMPDGYRVPPHYHSQPERVTVLQGVLNLGSGPTFDASATKALPAGTYSSMSPGMTHFGSMTGETVLQLSTIGPWTITYVNAADDPRRARKP
jgi:quercetin dioxygenase-like cupin family protein